MSRSRRKSPYRGVCADSDKFDKRLANRRLRRINKMRLEKGLEPLELRDVSDEWCFNKDGKMYIEPNSKWMRK